MKRSAAQGWLKYIGVFAWVLVGLSSARAEWSPSTGKWGKSDPNDVRIMTYNIRDHICRTQAKVEGYNGWCALARVVASMKPDVLFLFETGDNSGNGTGSGVDSVSQLATVLDLFLHGGTDPFLGGAVTSYVQLYAPGYDLPYVGVSDQHDNYNRNCILSRFPFADLNGDGLSQRSLPAAVFADLYAWGPPTGIRGFMFGELNLPDAIYAGDLVVGAAHLKSGSASGDYTDREREARNMAYYIDYLFNGGGTSTPDPRARIQDNPAATRILDPNTPVIIGGDWNEDEQTNNRKGPAEWLTRAELTGGTDGTDRDRSDMTYDSAVNPYNNNRSTQSSSKLDYLAWQDSIATLRRAFVFNSATAAAWYPPECIGFSVGVNALSATASDHRPVIADFILPLAPPPPPPVCAGDGNCDGVIDWRDIDFLVAGQNDNSAAWAQLFAPGTPTCAFDSLDANEDGSVDWRDIDPFVALMNTTCP